MESRELNQSLPKDDYGEPFEAGTYRAKKRKIQVLKNGSAFSIAGDAGLVDELLKKAVGIDDSKPYDGMVREYSHLFQNEYLDAYDNDPNRPHCAFLFCGYIGATGHKAPQIYQLSSFRSFSLKPRDVYAFTGREFHGAALYLHHRLYRKEGMSMDSAKCLAYCALSEVADMDNMVGRPIEMVIITESGVEPLTDFARYEQKRKEVTAKLFDLLHPNQP